MSTGDRPRANPRRSDSDYYERTIIRAPVRTKGRERERERERDYEEVSTYRHRSRPDFLRDDYDKIDGAPLVIRPRTWDRTRRSPVRDFRYAMGDSPSRRSTERVSTRIVERERVDRDGDDIYVEEVRREFPPPQREFPPPPREFPPPPRDERAPSPVDERVVEVRTETINRYFRQVDEVIWDLSRAKNVTLHLDLDVTEDLEPYLNQFCHLNRLGDYHQTEQYFRDNLEEHMDDAYVFVQYAQMLLEMGNYSGIQALEVPYSLQESTNKLLQTNWKLIQSLSGLHTGRVSEEDLQFFAQQATEEVLALLPARSDDGASEGDDRRTARVVELERPRVRVVETRERIPGRERSLSPPLAPQYPLRSRVIETRERIPVRERSSSPVRVRERIIERRERTPSPPVNVPPAVVPKGTTSDWTIVDVPSGTERVRMNLGENEDEEIFYRRYDDLRRSKFDHRRDELESIKRRRMDEAANDIKIYQRSPSPMKSTEARWGSSEAGVIADEKSPLGSTECQILNLGLRILARLPRVSKTIGAGKSSWKMIYEDLLRQGRIWDFRDTFIAAVLYYGREEACQEFFESSDSPLNRIVADWSTAIFDESTNLALLDILVSLVLCQSPTPSTITGMRHLVDKSSTFASSIVKNDPSKLKSRQYIRWVLAKVAVTSYRDVSISSSSHLPGLFLERSSALELPIYVPKASEFDDWNDLFFHTRSFETLKMITKAAKELEDFETEALCLKQLILHSEDPAEYFDQLIRLQKQSQWDIDGCLRTCLSKYIICRDKKSRDSLREEILSVRDYHNFDSNLAWAKGMILRSLAHSASEADLALSAANEAKRSMEGHSRDNVDQIDRHKLGETGGSQERPHSPEVVNAKEGTAQGWNSKAPQSVNRWVDNHFAFEQDQARASAKENMRTNDVLDHKPAAESKKETATQKKSEPAKQNLPPMRVAKDKGSQVLHDVKPSIENNPKQSDVYDPERKTSFHITEGGVHYVDDNPYTATAATNLADKSQVKDSQDPVEDDSKSSRVDVLQKKLGDITASDLRKGLTTVAAAGINALRNSTALDRSRSSSRSRSWSSSRSRERGSGLGNGLAALAIAGLGALKAKNGVDNYRSRHRGRTRSRDHGVRPPYEPRRRYSSDSSFSTSRNPPTNEGRSIIVEGARAGLARLGLGKTSGAPTLREDRRSRVRERKPKKRNYRDRGSPSASVDPELGMVMYGVEPVYTNAVSDTTSNNAPENANSGHNGRHSYVEEDYSPSPPPATGGAFYPENNKFPPPPGVDNKPQPIITDTPAVPPYNPADYPYHQAPTQPTYTFPPPPQTVNEMRSKRRASSPPSADSSTKSTATVVPTEQGDLEAGYPSSIKSSTFRDESDYKKSATTRTGQSGRDSDDNVTIKVKGGQARIMVEGAQIGHTEGDGGTEPVTSNNTRPPAVSVSSVVEEID